MKSEKITVVVELCYTSGTEIELGDVLGWLSSWENWGGLVLILTFLAGIKYFDHFLIYIRFKEVILI